MNAPARITSITFRGETLWTEGTPLAARNRWEAERRSWWREVIGWALMLCGPCAAFLLGLLAVLPDA